jgi:hypothetical protein
VISAWPPNCLRIADEQLAGEVGLAARGEAFVKGGAERSGRSADLDGGEHRPAALARVGDTSAELGEIRRAGERGRGEVEQPEGEDRAAPPDLRDRGHVDRVAVVIAIAKRCRSGVAGPLFAADVRPLQDVQALGIGGHQPVLDPVMDHLDEVAGAARSAVQIAAFGGRGLAGAARGASAASVHAG